MPIELWRQLPHFGKSGSQRRQRAPSLPIPKGTKVGTVGYVQVSVTIAYAFELPAFSRVNGI